MTPPHPHPPTPNPRAGCPHCVHRDSGLPAGMVGWCFFQEPHGWQGEPWGGLRRPGSQLGRRIPRSQGLGARGSVLGTDRGGRREGFEGRTPRKASCLQRWLRPRAGLFSGCHGVDCKGAGCPMQGAGACRGCQGPCLPVPSPAPAGASPALQPWGRGARSRALLRVLHPDGPRRQLPAALGCPSLSPALPAASAGGTATGLAPCPQLP